jgi:monovalent cation:H+ antiporter-2, CPA2 family
LESVLSYAVIALGISVVLNLFLKYAGISPIIGYIVTGVLIAYGFDLQYAADSHLLELVGEFGIVFLMFTIGLEISLKKMKAMRTEVFGNGSLQVGVSTAIFYAIAHYGFSIAASSALIIALALSLSSTAVVLSYLKASKQIYQPYGQRATGILVFQDLAVIPILLLIGFLSIENLDIQLVVVETLFSALIVLGLLFIVGKTVMTWLLHFSAGSQTDELFIGSVLVILLGASLFAHFMGFTYSLGAFIAGMIIADTKYHHKVEADIGPFKDLLLGIFFVSVGLKIHIGYFIDHVVEILLLLVTIFAIKSVIIYAIVRLSSKRDTSLKTALALAQVGEFSFAIFALAHSANLINTDLTQMLVLTVVLSMVLTPFMIARIDALVINVLHEETFEQDLNALQTRHNHIIVCGYSTVGMFVTNELDSLQTEYMVVSNSFKHAKRAQMHGRSVYFGDISKRSMIEALHVENAAAVIITLESFEKIRLICEALREYAHKVKIIVKVATLEEKQTLEAMNIGVVVDSKRVISHVLVSEARSCAL